MHASESWWDLCQLVRAGLELRQRVCQLLRIHPARGRHVLLAPGMHVALARGALVALSPQAPQQRAAVVAERRAHVRVHFEAVRDVDAKA